MLRKNGRRSPRASNKGSYGNYTFAARLIGRSDTGDIAASLGYDPTDPSANKALLRVASRMRGVAIVAANDANLSGIVRTSNPRSVPRLLEQTGTTRATVIPLTRAEACKRIRRIFPNDRDRAALCEIGLDRYFDNE